MTIQLASDAIFQSRLDVCKGCDRSKAEAFEGGGQCLACGCPVQKKLRIKTEACPLGKWGPDVSTEGVQLSVRAVPERAMPPQPQVIPPHVPPTITDMAKSFFSSAAMFVAAGLPRTPLEQLQVRLDTCKVCQYWNPEGFAGTGSCRQCGCSTQAKLRMATSECPMGYWQAVAPHAEG